MKTARRFWSFVKKGRGCWVWQGAQRNGYGALRWKGTHTFAHRVAYELATGTPPPPRTQARDTPVLCHSCDNTLCVKPAHLSLGTMADNMRHRSERDRQSSKLTRETALRAKRLLAQAWRQVDVAKAVGVTQGTISALARGATWSHVKPPELLSKQATK